MTCAGADMTIAAAAWLDVAGIECVALDVRRGGGRRHRIDHLQDAMFRAHHQAVGLGADDIDQFVR